MLQIFLPRHLQTKPSPLARGGWALSFAAVGCGLQAAQYLTLCQRVADQLVQQESAWRCPPSVESGIGLKVRNATCPRSVYPVNGGRENRHHGRVIGVGVMA